MNEYSLWDERSSKDLMKRENDFDGNLDSISTQCVSYQVQNC